MTWLVTGASGYIGQHLILRLLEDGLEVLGLDIAPLPALSPLKGKFELLAGDIRDPNFLGYLFEKRKFQGIVNLAALKSVEESIKHPERYLLTNLSGVKNLLKAGTDNGVEYFIQSSTAAVYGAPESGIVYESDATKPISPYGISKLLAETALLKASDDGLVTALSLRYFNVVGSAHLLLKDHSVANLVPKVIQSIKLGQAPHIYGDDYQTKDGTCIRDYVHVLDIAEAHAKAIQVLRKRKLPQVLNIGTGHGYSVREVITEIKRQHGSNIEPLIVGRRKGDPASLIANVELSENEIGFKAQYGLREMVESSL